MEPETENVVKTAGTEAVETDYQGRVSQFLSRAGIDFTVQFIGDSCPQFCEDTGKPGIGQFPRKTHIHGQHWRATFVRDGREPTKGYERLTIDFWDSYHDSIRRYCARNWSRAENQAKIAALNCRNNRASPAQWDIIEATFPPLEWRNLKPSAYDVLSCIGHYEPTAPFEEWAAEFGYDPDSRKDERIYRAVCEQWRKTFRFFTIEELETLAEIAV